MNELVAFMSELGRTRSGAFGDIFHLVHDGCWSIAGLVLQRHASEMV